jgi:cellulose synthase (UDP-forming)
VARADAGADIQRGIEVTSIQIGPVEPQLMRHQLDYDLPSAPNEREKWLYYGRQHRWFIWLRTFATLSAVTSLVLFSNTTVLLWWFWVPFTVFIGYMVLTHYCTSRRRRFSKVDHLSIVELWSPDHYPAVDVFLPCAGEELAVLNNTYSHVARLDYPGAVTVHVLDDGDREEVRKLAQAYDFIYHVRPNRGHMKKAGNLKYGFENSDGDLIVIFDADFCPRPDFIRELTPYFDDDPVVGIVQSPQYFDAHHMMPWLQRCAGTVQESFYRWAQVSRDRLGAPICVGTCAIYRRKALLESGGFAQIGHSEDVHTGVNMMKAGYKTLYVPVVLAKGLCPDKLASFISQQYRWCAGSMSLLRDKGFHDAPLTYRQRMCFFTGFGYYISTGIGVFTLPLPTIIMVWFLPNRVVLSNFFWLIPTFLMYPIIQVVHKSGWTPATIRVYTISAFSHAAAIWHTLQGRTAEWVPSGETRRTSMTSRVTMLMLFWLATANLLMFAGVAHFLAGGRSIIDVAPVLAISTLNWFTWMPIAAMAWRERRTRLHVIAATALLPQAS